MNGTQQTQTKNPKLASPPPTAITISIAYTHNSNTLTKTAEQKETQREIERLSIRPHGILVAAATAQIAIKRLRDVEHTRDVVHAQGRFFVESKGLGCADGILYL